jgi:hypothetical protein
MKPKPKIYISLPESSIEDVAKRAGVSNRRLKELKVIIANLNEGGAPRQARPTGKPSARKPSKRTANR